MTVSNNEHHCKYEVIDDETQLQAKLNYWNTLSHIVIDTEFMRVNTFYPIPGLIQVADDIGIYLIDPVEIPDLTILQPLLKGDTVKVMHSMSEDIALFQRVTACTPVNIFDTQIACALLGHGLSVGYQKLIEIYLNIVIDKGETRSDWLKRPLSESQLDYAAKDVHYLYQIYPRLKAELATKGLDGVVLSESSLINSAMEITSTDVDHYYLKFRAAWKYDAQKQRELKIISRWREEEARKKDKPRSRIVSDKQILEIVERSPITANALRASGLLNPVQFRKYGDLLMSFLGCTDTEGAVLEPIPRPLSGQRLAMYRTLKKTVEKVAIELDIAPELLGRKRLLEEYVTSSYDLLSKGMKAALPSSFGEWRTALLSEPFDKIIEGSSYD